MSCSISPLVAIAFRVLIHARSHSINPLTVIELAEVAALSPRQFSRAFRAQTGQSPANRVMSPFNSTALRVKVAYAPTNRYDNCRLAAWLPG